jgi:hypothetical protein
VLRDSSVVQSLSVNIFNGEEGHSASLLFFVVKGIHHCGRFRSPSNGVKSPHLLKRRLWTI